MPAPSDASCPTDGSRDHVQRLCFYVRYQTVPISIRSHPRTTRPSGFPLQTRRRLSYASQCSSRSGLPPSFLLQELLLCPSLLLLLLADPAPAVASPDELVSIPAENHFRKLFEASQCSLQDGLRPKEHSISNCERRSLEASQCSLSGDPPPLPMLIHDSCYEPDLSVGHPSKQELLQSS